MGLGRFPLFHLAVADSLLRIKCSRFFIVTGLNRAVSAGDGAGKIPSISLGCS